MYSEEYLSVCKTDDGKYLVSVKVKRKKDKGSKDMIMGSMSDMKTFVADDEGDVADAVKKLLPKIKSGGLDDAEFGKAFKGEGEEEEEE